jgi:hypothetical protein
MSSPDIPNKDSHPHLSAKPANEVIKEIEAEPVLPRRIKVESLDAEMQEKMLVQLEKQQELRKLTAEADKMVQDNQGRREFSRSIFRVTVAWMFLVLAVVCLCASSKWHLSDSVLIALITTTTATVIGIFIIVANYLFNRDKST